MPREFQDNAVESRKAVDGSVSQCAPCEDTEPNLDLIQPATVLRRKDESNSGVAVEPSPGVGSSPGADVISDDDEGPSTIEAYQDSITLVGQQNDPGPDDLPMRRAAAPNQRLQPATGFGFEPDSIFGYSPLHPSFSSSFVERQLDSAGERMGVSKYFHASNEAILTFETQH
jgi:hypothetical protein